MKRLGKQRSFFNGKSWRLPLALIILTLVSVTLSINSKHPTTTQAAPFGGCDTNGYLYKYPGGPTNVHTVDMVTGQDPNGFLYGSSNSTGNLWRVNVNATSFTAEQVGTGNPSSSNDGARCALAPVPIDFGDAPSSYSTTLGEDGPRHGIIGFNDFNSSAPLMLGKKVDIENDGFPGANATGDDANHTGPDGNVDDERGVTHIVATPTTSTPLTVPVYITNASSSPATLAGWIDLDNDGIFETGERVMAAVSANFNGYKELTFPAPPAPYTVNTFSRFRIFSGTVADPQPTGAASGGEIEDILVQVGTYDVSKTANPAEDGNVGSGQIVTYTLTIKNTGLTALTNLKIDDNLADVLDDATLQGNPIINPTSAGSASVSDNVLEFVGDVGIGQTVTVTYAVKVKDAGSLGNAALHNSVLAAHSTNCHHEVDDDGSATADHPDCSTSHTILGLANTGGNFFVPILVAVGLLGSSGATLYYVRKNSRTIPHTTGQK